MHMCFNHKFCFWVIIKEIQSKLVKLYFEGFKFTVFELCPLVTLQIEISLVSLIIKITLDKIFWCKMDSGHILFSIPSVFKKIKPFVGILKSFNIILIIFFHRFIIDNLYEEKLYLITLNASVNVDARSEPVYSAIMENNLLPKAVCEWTSDFYIASK